jgi:cytochrome c-type biogenesis protein CcmH
VTVAEPTARPNAGAHGSRRALLVIGAAIVVLVIAVVLGRGRSGPETVTSRADRIASEIRCPVCQGLSVRASKAAGARAIYAEITRQVQANERDEDIRAFLVDRYGTSELLRPSATGVGAVVWIAPVAAFLLGAAVLVRVFTRTRRRPVPVSPEDQALVDVALALPRDDR